MTAYGSECFTMNEVNRLKILQDVIDGRLTTSLASQRLGITDRHCRRLLARYRESGPLALANRRRGLRGNRQVAQSNGGSKTHLIPAMGSKGLHRISVHTRPGIQHRVTG